MTSRKIKVNLNVSGDLSKKALWETYRLLPQEISKVIGVYLDNALEASSNAKEKIVDIQFYLEKRDIIFCLANTYDGKIEIDKLDMEGYSSKGKGRGYGLSLVKDILEKHAELEQNRYLMDEYYVQELRIKSIKK